MARSAFKPPGVAPSVRPRQAYAEEFPGRVFLHGIADAFATRADLSEPTEGIVVEAEPACPVDPDRPCTHFAPDATSRPQTACEAGRLQAEPPVIRPPECSEETRDGQGGDDTARPGGLRR